jgi:Ni/Co efflux regulator RcnB
MLKILTVLSALAFLAVATPASADARATDGVKNQRVEHNVRKHRHHARHAVRHHRRHRH